MAGIRSPASEYGTSAWKTEEEDCRSEQDGSDTIQTDSSTRTYCLHIDPGWLV